MIFTLTSGTMNTILCYLRLTDLPREGCVLTSGYVVSRHSRHTADGLVCYEFSHHQFGSRSNISAATQTFWDFCMRRIACSTPGEFLHRR
jgi:hypothetical protein